MSLEHEKKLPTGNISVQAVDGLDTKEEIETDLLSDDEFTDAEYSRLLWKIDFIIMVGSTMFSKPPKFAVAHTQPMLMILYGLQFADKTSLSRGVIFVSQPSMPATQFRLTSGIAGGHWPRCG